MTHRLASLAHRLLGRPRPAGRPAPAQPRLGLTLLESREVPAYLQFDFHITDPTLAADARIKPALEAAGAILSEAVSGADDTRAVDIDVQVTAVREVSGMLAGALNATWWRTGEYDAAAGRYVYETDAAHDAREGASDAGYEFELRVNVHHLNYRPDLGDVNGFFIDPTGVDRSEAVPVPSGQYDFISVAMHELGHGLGIDGGRVDDTPTADGTFFPNWDAADAYSTFDRLMVQSGGPGGAWYFTGSKAVAANGGTPVPLESTRQGSYYYHTARPAPTHDLMSAGITPGIRKSPGAVDVAILQDLGFNGPQQVVGGPVVFSVGLNNQVYRLRQDAVGNPVEGYAQVTHGEVKAVSGGRTADGHALLFAIGMNNHVYRVKFNAAVDATTGYELVTGGEVKSIAAGRDGFGNPMLFAVGLNDVVYQVRMDADGDALTGYLPVAAPATVKSIAVTVDQSGNPLLFAVGTDDEVYRLRMDAAGNVTQGYVALQPRADVKSIAVTTTPEGNPLLFAIGLDDNVYRMRLDADGDLTEGFAPVAGATGVQSISTGRDAFGRPVLIAVKPDRVSYRMRLDYNGDSISPFVAMSNNAQVLAASIIW